MLSRRSLLAAGGVVLGGADPAPRLPPSAGLHAHAVRKGLFYGSAIDTEWLGHDPVVMSHVAIECGMLVSENSFKWYEMRPAPDRFDFERPERLMAYAAQHGMRVRGHALAWHLSNPAWLEQIITVDNAERLLTAHIGETVGHFRHRVVQWDVVNEALQPDDDKPNGFRDTVWYRTLGPSYLDIAFHAAEAADPSALRVLNEYGLEEVAPWQEKRRGLMRELLAALKSRHVPVQALGIQAHLNTDNRIDQKLLQRFLDDVVAMDCKLVVTEMDVYDGSLPGDIATRDAAVAAHAREFLEVILPYTQMLGVVTWGLSDKYNRQDGGLPRADRLPHRPLPLDAGFRRKPLWTAMAGSFDLAPRRGGAQ